MNVYLDSVGCRLNQSEIESYARHFRAAGHHLVECADQADLVVINTCTVTAEAASDSRQKIRQVSRAGASQIAVTGCWATLNVEAALAMPGVSHVVPNLRKDHLVTEVLHLPVDHFESGFIERQPIPGARLRTRAFIKVQDGCDNRCTFCLTTIARGPGRSRSLTAILAEIRAALAGNSQEIVLSGVHLGSWGHDFTPPSSLHYLVQSILSETNPPRLRLSSLEPWDLQADFFELWRDPRLCRHLHLPLQSGSAATLRRMARKITPGAFASLVEAARAAIPEVAITTDVITGFPGESETEFAESAQFIQAVDFAGGHVFSYSARPGTAAARLPDQVQPPVRKNRNHIVRDILKSSAAAYQVRFIGKELTVLWESLTALDDTGWQLSGLSDNCLRITALAPQALWNTLTPVRLTGHNQAGLHGLILE